MEEYATIILIHLNAHAVWDFREYDVRQILTIANRSHVKTAGRVMMQLQDILVNVRLDIMVI